MFNKLTLFQMLKQMQNFKSLLLRKMLMNHLIVKLTKNCKIWTVFSS